MAVRLIQSHEPITVNVISFLAFGQPGSRKSSLAQTAAEPLTMAFDEGIYRAYNRKTAALFDDWEDVVNFDVRPYKTVVVDTLGKCLDKLASALIRENPKNGNRLGGLSLPGYGVLKTRFAAWVSSLREAQKMIVFVAQEKSERVGEENYFFPEIVGSNYGTVMDNADVVGYLHFENNKRVLDFNPSDTHMAKHPPAWGEYARKFMTGKPGQIVLPDFEQEPHFLQNLMNEAKASMGRISAESAAVAQAVKDWQDWLDTQPDLENINKRLENLAAVTGAAKVQAWHLVSTFCTAQGWIFEKASKQFRVKEVA